MDALRATLLDLSILDDAADIPRPGSSGRSEPFFTKVAIGTLYLGTQAWAGRTAIAQGWERLGGRVQVVHDFWRFGGHAKEGDCVFGGGFFCQVLAERIGLRLQSPRNFWLSQITREWTRRDIRVRKLDEVVWPAFVKPMDHEGFRAGIYQSFEELAARSWRLLSKSSSVLTAEIITVHCEARAFVANREILDICVYFGDSSLDGARAFLNEFLDVHQFELACVVDLVRIRGRGWAILEFNPCWASEHYTCDPAKVLACTRKACVAQAK